MDQRPCKEDTFMELAYVWAKRSTCTKTIAVGCVLINNMDQVIASGYNGAPRGIPHCDGLGGDCDLYKDIDSPRHIHAEENAILQCALNGISSKNCVLYVTHSPCLRCALRIIQAGIVGVMFEKETTDISRVENLFMYSKVVIKQRRPNE